MKLKEDAPRLRRLYLELCQKAGERNGKPSRLSDTKQGYENHHMIPKLWGGNDHPKNLVRLTYREHYLAHLLLSHLMGSKFLMLADTSRTYSAMKTALRVVQIALASTPEAKARASRRARNQDNSARVKPTSRSNLLRSAANKSKVFTCPHCGKVGGGGMTRWHFDHCRNKQ